MPDSTYAPTKFPVRTVLYGIVILYLFCDVYWLHGPIHRMIRRHRDSGLPPQSQRVARVNGTILTRSDLDRTLDAYLYVRGKTRADLPGSGTNRLAIQVAALNQMVEDELLRAYSELKPEPVSDEEVAAELSRFTQQFPDREDFEKRLAAQGLDEPGLRERMRARVLQTKWLETRVAKVATVSDDEAEAWFMANREKLKAPETIRAGHIFLTRHDAEKPDREPEIRAIYARLVAGDSTFEELAGKHSEDERSKEVGGDLGYFSRNRMPADFCDAVFAMEPGAVSEPFETRLGWHIVRVTVKVAARNATFDEMRDEVVAHLESTKRQQAVDLLLLDLKSRARLEYFYENLDK